MIYLRAYIGIKYHENYNNKSVVDKISSVLEKKGYKTICIVRDIRDDGQTKYTPNELMELTFEKINACDLVVIELTEKGVGLGIEAGYAYANKIPIITMAKRGFDISETLVGISNRIITYDDIENIDIELKDL